MENVDICGLVVRSSLFIRCFALFRRNNFIHRYAWCLTYFMNTHRDVYIVLKKSLKWVPILGWVCKKTFDQSPPPSVQ